MFLVKNLILMAIFSRIQSLETVGLRGLGFRPDEELGDGNSDYCKSFWEPGKRCIYLKENRKSSVIVKIEDCPAGSFSNLLLTTDKTRCTLCSPGEWQTQTGQSYCNGKKCEDGFYDSSPPETPGVCLPCPIHHYSNSKVGTYECDVCVGTTNTPDSDGCLNRMCLNGTFYQNGECLACPAGTSPKWDHHSCVPCPGYSWSLGNSSVCTPVQIARFTRPPSHPDKTKPFQSTSIILFFSVEYGIAVWICIVSLLVSMITVYLDKNLNNCAKILVVLIPLSLLLGFLATDRGEVYDSRYFKGLAISLVFWDLIFIRNAIKGSAKILQKGSTTPSRNARGDI